jgi:hypothetical protein
MWGLFLGSTQIRLRLGRFIRIPPAQSPFPRNLAFFTIHAEQAGCAATNRTFDIHYVLFIRRVQE